MKINSIYESVYIPQIQILEESSNSNPKIKFKARLQEADVVNNNNRVYPADTLMTVVQQLQPKANTRMLVGEMDHPTPQGDDAAKLKRSSTLSLDNACVLYTRLEFDGKYVIADCETLSNAKGKDLFHLIQDKVAVGFSLRAFGGTVVDPITKVQKVQSKSIKSLTYDVVGNPSHGNSVIIEFLSEGSEFDIRTLQDALTLNQELFESSSFDAEVQCCLSTIDGCNLNESIYFGEIQDYLTHLKAQELKSLNALREMRFKF
jgi:hypothetical protein